MLIGAHVSPAGGPAKAVERGEERGCRAIQIFNQSPRAWRPREYSADEVAAFHAAMEGSKKVEALLIHAVYLLNCASEDREMRDKSLTALAAALQAGAALGVLALVDRPLVPVDPQPLERVEDLLDVLRRGALAVRVLDPEHELPVRAAGQKPVVQCRARAADVQLAGWRRREANSHWI